HAVGRVQADVGAVHPEQVGQGLAGGLGLQLGPVLGERRDVHGHVDVRVDLVERRDVLLDRGHLVLVPDAVGDRGSEGGAGRGVRAAGGAGRTGRGTAGGQGGGEHDGGGGEGRAAEGGGAARRGREVVLPEDSGAAVRRAKWSSTWSGSAGPWGGPD